jgi:Domain of unknown function (DUF4365)
MSSRTERHGIYAVGLIVHEQLGWIFREQPIEDWGIDAQIEVVDESGPTGRLDDRSADTYRREVDRRLLRIGNVGAS